MPTSDPRDAPTRPGLTACSLCAGETLGPADPLAGGQLARLEQLRDRGLADLTTSECLDECERGDVVVVRPSRVGRQRGGRPVWFERLAGDATTAGLARWLELGGPGVAEVPDALTSHRIARSSAALDLP